MAGELAASTVVRLVPQKVVSSVDWRAVSMVVQRDA